MPYQFHVSPPGCSEFLILAEAEDFISAQPKTADTRKFQFKPFTSRKAVMTANILPNLCRLQVTSNEEHYCE